MIAVREGIRDLDDFVLLTADHAALADFYQNISGLQVELFGGAVNVEQEAGIDTGVAPKALPTGHLLTPREQTIQSVCSLRLMCALCIRK